MVFGKLGALAVNWQWRMESRSAVERRQSKMGETLRQPCGTCWHWKRDVSSCGTWRKLVSKRFKKPTNDFRVTLPVCNALAHCRMNQKGAKWDPKWMEQGQSSGKSWTVVTGLCDHLALMGTDRPTLPDLFVWWKCPSTQNHLLWRFTNLGKLPSCCLKVQSGEAKRLRWTNCFTSSSRTAESPFCKRTDFSGGILRWMKLMPTEDLASYMFLGVSLPSPSNWEAQHRQLLVPMHFFSASIIFLV